MSNPLDTFAITAKADALRRLKAGALLLRTEIATQLSQPGTGRFYKVRKGKGFRTVTVKQAGPLRRGEKRSSFKESRRNLSKFHQASVPGAPPAPDTNTLKRSAYVEQSGALQFTVGVATKYARGLEFGTANVKPRPFMRPAFASWRQKVGDLFHTSGLK